jgi:hypothetical protein
MAKPQERKVELALVCVLRLKLEPFILWKGVSPSLGLKKCEVGLHLSLSEAKVLPFDVNNKLIFPIWKDPSITEGMPRCMYSTACISCKKRS